MKKYLMGVVVFLCLLGFQSALQGQATDATQSGAPGATVTIPNAETGISSPSASTIGNWSGSGRSWNNTAFSTIKALMTANGHIVEADTAMTAANLANDGLYVVGEATGAPTAGELTDLSDWVTGGGILLLLADSSGAGAAGGNAILTALGSSISIGGSPGNAPLAGGIFASEGPPFNIVGQSIATSPGTAVTGGNTLAGTYIRYENIGCGFVFAFADRIDHNFFATSAGNVNGQLFLNLANGSAAASNAVLDIQLCQTSYVNGETVTATVFRLANPTATDVAVELKVWVRIPGAPPISFFNVGSDGSFVIPAGVDQDFGPVPLFQVTPDLPPGNYEFSARMLDPLTGELLGEDLNPFTIEAAPAASSFQPAGANDVESFVAAIVPGSPFLEIQLSQASYLNGETVTASVLQLANPGAADAAAEVKVWIRIRIPGAPPISFANEGSDGSFLIPAGFDQDFGPAPIFQVTPDLPPAPDYEFSSRMIDPVTGELLSEDLNPFAIQ